MTKVDLDVLDPVQVADMKALFPDFDLERLQAMTTAVNARIADVIDYERTNRPVTPSTRRTVMQEMVAFENQKKHSVDSWQSHWEEVETSEEFGGKGTTGEMREAPKWLFADLKLPERAVDYEDLALQLQMNNDGQVREACSLLLTEDADPRRVLPQLLDAYLKFRGSSQTTAQKVAKVIIDTIDMDLAAVSRHLQRRNVAQAKVVIEGLEARMALFSSEKDRLNNLIAQSPLSPEEKDKIEVK